MALIAAALGYGEVRLRQSETAPTAKVGLVAIDEFIGSEAQPERAEAVWRAYDENVVRLANQGARVVVLPEKIAALTPEKAARREREMASLAQRTGVYLEWACS